jgi:hypothetical protein
MLELIALIHDENNSRRFQRTPEGEPPKQRGGGHHL